MYLRDGCLINLSLFSMAYVKYRRVTPSTLSCDCSGWVRVHSMICTQLYHERICI